MSAMTIRFEEELYNRLQSAAKNLHASKSYVAKQAIRAYLNELEEDMQDYNDALESLKDSGTIYSLEQIKRECGLED